MKTKFRVILAAAGGLLLAGGLLCLVAMAGVGFRMEGLSNAGPWEERRFTQPAGDVSELVLHAANFRVSVTPYDGDAVDIRYWENEETKFEASYEGGRVTLAQKPYERRVWRISMDAKIPPDIEVRIPREHVLACEIRTTNDVVQVSQLAFTQLSVTSSNGSLVMQDVAAAEGDIKLKTTNDAITLKNLSAGGRVEGVTTNGTIDAENLRCQDLELRSTNDTLRLRDAVCLGSAQLHTTNGELRLEGVDIPRITATTTNDGVEFSGLEFQSASFTTTNSDIIGSLPGPEADYTVTASTTNGRVHAGSPRANGGKTLALQTTNGDIDISFGQ
jgi:hypothetical protein